MLIHPKSTLRVLCMPMHLSSGHVTLLPGKFHPLSFPEIFPQLNLRRRANSRWVLPQISSLYCFCVFFHSVLFIVWDYRGINDHYWLHK